MCTPKNQSVKCHAVVKEKKHTEACNEASEVDRLLTIYQPISTSNTQLYSSSRDLNEIDLGQK